MAPRPKRPCPLRKCPLYFRRAAINAAISMYRSYVGKLKAWQEGPMKKAESPARQSVCTCPCSTTKACTKNFDEKSILLKLYTGKAWAWVKHRYTGRPFPENAELMSPTIVIKKQKSHAPHPC